MATLQSSSSRTKSRFQIPLFGIFGKERERTRLPGAGYMTRSGNTRTRCQRSWQQLRALYSRNAAGRDLLRTCGESYSNSGVLGTTSGPLPAARNIETFQANPIFGGIVTDGARRRNYGR